MSHFQLIVFTVLYEKKYGNLDQTPQNMIKNASEKIRIQDICLKSQNLFVVPYPICKVVIVNSLFYTDVTTKYTSCVYLIRAQFLSMWDTNSNYNATRGLTISHSSCKGQRI